MCIGNISFWEIPKQRVIILQVFSKHTRPQSNVTAHRYFSTWSEHFCNIFDQAVWCWIEATTPMRRGTGFPLQKSAGVSHQHWTSACSSGLGLNINFKHHLFTPGDSSRMYWSPPCSVPNGFETLWCSQSTKEIQQWLRGIQTKCLVGKKTRIFQEVGSNHPLRWTLCFLFCFFPPLFVPVLPHKFYSENIDLVWITYLYTWHHVSTMAKVTGRVDNGKIIMRVLFCFSFWVFEPPSLCPIITLVSFSFPWKYCFQIKVSCISLLFIMAGTVLSRVSLKFQW